MTSTQILERQIKDWKIKYDNLASAKKISEENLNREITDLKKQLETKDRQIDSLVQIIGKMDKKIDDLTERVAELTKENTQLRETISIQNDQIAKLKSRIDKDSNNSSKPPSTDGFRKTVQNNREKTGRKAGGQPGHRGHRLQPFADPTEINERKVHVCDCGGDVKSDAGYEARQLVDIVISLSIREERVYSGTCVICGKRHYAEFPEGFANPVQYGENIKALAVLLNNHGCVSVNRTREIINSITDNRLNLSDATIVNIQNSLSSKLGSVLEGIKNNLIACRVLNADETGCRLNAKINWVQVFSNRLFTLCGINEKRGSLSIEGMGVLDYFIGILVHDHFSSYYKNNLVTHAECNAHILRYLKGVMETFRHEWAQEMTGFLKDILDMKKEHAAAGKISILPEKLEEISKRYDAILEKGWREYEDSVRGKKNISYYKDEQLLLKRLGEFKKEHLLFISNFEAPFDNNQAERDLRCLKTKIKVSGCFRSIKGGESFTKIYSLVSTLKKHNMCVYKNIRDVFRGNDPVFI